MKTRKVIKSLSKVEGESYKIRLDFNELAEALKKDAEGLYFFDIYIKKNQKPDENNQLEISIDSEKPSRETHGYLDTFDLIFRDLLEPEEFKKFLQKYSKKKDYA